MPWTEPNKQQIKKNIKRATSSRITLTDLQLDEKNMSNLDTNYCSTQLNLERNKGNHNSNTEEVLIV